MRLWRLVGRATWLCRRSARRRCASQRRSARALREAEETLEPIQAERRAAEDALDAARAEREAVEHSLADKHRELVQLEAKILADSETVQTSLEAVRASLDARGQSLGERESDVRRRDE